MKGKLAHEGRGFSQKRASITEVLGAPQLKVAELEQQRTVVRKQVTLGLLCTVGDTTGLLPFKQSRPRGAHQYIVDGALGVGA